MEQILEDVHTYIRVNFQNTRRNQTLKKKVLNHFLINDLPFVCCFCGICLTLRGNVEGRLPDDFLTIEHLKPIAEFEPEDDKKILDRKYNRLENLSLSCYKCNHERSVKTWVKMQKVRNEL